MFDASNFRFWILDCRLRSPFPYVQSKIQNPKSKISSVVFGITLALAAAPHVGAEPYVDHGAWDVLVRAHVNSEGVVDYAALGQRRATLEAYLATLADADVASLSRDEQLAFWINAYNACVVKGVLDRYPIKSVKEVKGFFDTIRYQVGGRLLTLNEIEANGRALGDWRLHFAVVCASSSCPFLRNEAYVPARLDAQLSDQVRRFLADASRGLRVDGGVLWVSKIFKWYAKDVVPTGPMTAKTLIPVITPYLALVLAQALAPQQLTLKFMDYDWSLNALAQR